jgi:hypothetical protein
MEELRKQLFNLAILHGLKRCSEVLDSIRDEVKAHGQFLVEEYNVVSEPSTLSTQVEPTIKHSESDKMEEEVKKVRKPRKKRTDEKQEVSTVDAVALNELTEKGVNEGVNESEVKEQPVKSQPLKGNAKKRWQREQEALKRQELLSKGIFKRDVLTIENVTEWIKAGRSYAEIARSYVGCTEEEVSKYCKKHHITNTK